jgi:hypothetical protein
MTNIDAVGAPAPPPPPPCQNPTVDLEVEKPTLTLRHDHANKLKIVVSPASCRATEYKIEIKRASGGGWFQLANTRSFRWIARVAGKFKLRGTAKVDGSDVQSGEKDVEVKFPTYAQIVSDGRVLAAARREWALTLRDCTPPRRRERCFWIQLDTKLNRYLCAPRSNGAWVGPNQGASVAPPPRPPDNPASPDPNAKGARYVVSMFHTHTATTYRPGPGVRPLGPSGADGNFHNAHQVPGVVYDYVSPVPATPANPHGAIPMGHPLAAPAMLYRSVGAGNIDPRPTP